MEWISLLWGTMVLRPYVFLFLAVYLTIAILNMGVMRSVFFTVLAYGIAFLSEYSSIHNGFPFGLYSYIDTTRGQELWVAGVPFMDSLSFSFLSYVSFTMGQLIWSPLSKKGWDVRLRGDCRSINYSLHVIGTGALLFMLMDVIIDPVAFQGDRWFLGKIYMYKEQGEYFNIPLTNFGGWLLVGFTILFLFTRVNRWLDSMHPVKSCDIKAQALLGPGLYFGVLIFNLAVTFYIGEVLLGILGTLIASGILALVLFKIHNPEKLRVQKGPGGRKPA